MEVLIGIAASAVTVGLVGLVRWILRRFSLKTKTEEAVGDLCVRVRLLEETLEQQKIDAALVRELKVTVDEVNAGMRPLVKSVFGLLLKAKEGKVNGEIEDALKDVRDYLGI